VVVLVSHDDAEIAELATNVARITILRGENTAAVLRN
jgi:ABC-type sulfate/molybdate transport systems ATPase subunit